MVNLNGSEHLNHPSMPEGPDELTNAAHDQSLPFDNTFIDDAHADLTAQNAELDQEVKQALAAKTERLSSLELLTSDEYVINELERRINAAISKAFNANIFLEVERPSIKGKKVANEADLSLNVIPLARSLGEGISMVEVTNQVASLVTHEKGIASVETAGPFVNITIDTAQMTSAVFSQVTAEGTHYGWFRDAEPEIIVIDYSSPNVAKNLTVAHLRSTIIGQSLLHLHEASGNIPFGVNHVGDWGTHFGNIIYQYQKELAEHGDTFTDELNNDPAKTLMRIYRKFNDDIKQLPEEGKKKALNAGRQAFLELENGNPDYVKLWHAFREWSLNDFSPIYERLNQIQFDAIQGESFYEDRMDDAVREGIEKEVLARTDDGSVVFPSQVLIDPSSMKENSQIMLTQHGEPRDEMVVKPSGGTVYLTRDIAAILYRARELGAKKLLYVIGKEQGSHCVELFNMAHQMGAVALGNAQHISFGHLNVGGRKMSSRGGTIMLLDQLLDEARDAANQVIDKHRQSDVDLPAGLAEQIGVNATIFNDLRQDRTKDIEFDPETDVPKMLTSGGATYIQYTNARLNSILSKVAALESNRQISTPEAMSRYATEAHKSEKNILILISLFPRIIKEATETNGPHRIAVYLTELCQAVNTFQSSRDLHVVNAETDDASAFRVGLVRATSQVIENAAHLLHMQLPERM